MIFQTARSGVGPPGRFVLCFYPCGLPIAAVVRDASAISFGQVTTKHSADHGESSTDDHEEHAGCEPASEVGKKEDNNSGVHQDCEHNSCDASCHVLPPSWTQNFCIGTTLFSCLTRAVSKIIRDRLKSLTVPHMLLQQTSVRPQFLEDLMRRVQLCLPDSTQSSGHSAIR